MKYKNTVISVIIIFVLMNIGCLTNNDDNNDNSNEFLKYAEYAIEINASGSYYLKVPFFSLRNIHINELVKKIEVLEGNPNYSLKKLNYSDIPYFNVTQLINEYSKTIEDYPKFPNNDMCLVIKGNNKTKLNFKIEGKYFGDLTLKNDINTSNYWFFSSNNNKSIWINIKASIISKNTRDYWNRDGLNFLLQNGWQTIEIKHGWVLQ